jgi:hypothetical protein
MDEMQITSDPVRPNGPPVLEDDADLPILTQEELSRLVLAHPPAQADPEEDAPQEDAPPPEPTDAQRYAAAEARCREAWARLSQEYGRQPTRKELKAAEGGNNEARAYWYRVLERDNLPAPPESPQVTACRAALAQKAEQHNAWIQACREATADEQRCLHAWQDLEKARLTSDQVSVEDIQAAIEAHRVAVVRATDVLPPLGPGLAAAERAAYVALGAAVHDDKRQRRNALAAQRAALIRGPLTETRDAYEEQLQTVQALTAEQQALDLELGFSPGTPRELLACWAYTGMEETVPRPKRLQPVEDLVAADATLLPVSTDAFPEAVRMGRVFIQYRGPRGPGRPTLQIQGLEQLRQNRLNEPALQKPGGVLEVSHEEEQILREHYGDAIQRVIPPMWHGTI